MWPPGPSSPPPARCPSFLDPQPPHQGLPPPIPLALRPPLKVSLAQTLRRNGWSQDALVVERDPRRGSAASTCSAPNPPERRFSSHLAGAGGRGAVARIREDPRLPTAYPAWLPNAFVGSRKKTGSAAKLPDQGQGRFPRPSKVVPVSVATGVRVWSHLDCQGFRTDIPSLTPLKGKADRAEAGGLLKEARDFCELHPPWLWILRTRREMNNMSR